MTRIPVEVIRQNLGQVDVKMTQDYLGVLDGATRAPASSPMDSSSRMLSNVSISGENSLRSATNIL